MRPNWINPPKIDKRDPDLALIEQVEEIYWEPYDHHVRHCFNLSRWHLEFKGKLDSGGPLPPNYADYETDIFDENNYPRYPRFSAKKNDSSKEFWNESTPEISLRLASLGDAAFIGIGEEHFGHVGSIMIICDIYRVRPKPISGFENLSNVENLKAYLRQCRTKCNNWQYAKKIALLDRMDEVEEHLFNGRTWVRGVTGFSMTNPVNFLFTALDDHHLVRVSYLGGFWSQDSNKISEKSYAVSLTPLWDFMSNFYIEEIEASEDKKYIAGKYEPGSDQEIIEPDEDFGF